MSRNTRVIQASPAEVWAVLADGWQYAGWVVGASRVRAVDPRWPAPGSRIHHSIGIWPALVDDHTEVLHQQPGVRLELRARGWPLGEAQVTVQLRPAGADCEVVLEEDAVSGPGLLVPGLVRHQMLHWRNVETLRRLAFLAERPGTAIQPPDEAHTGVEAAGREDA